MGDLGRWALLFLLFVVPYTFLANLLGAITGSRRLKGSGRVGMLVITGLATVASISLMILLINDDFRYQYVINYSSSDLPLIYKISAFWGGNAGSLLLWLWILSIYGALATYINHRHKERMQPIVAAVLSGILFFFVLLLNTISQPFALAPFEATEGNSLNPLLQNPSMTIHPINLYLGYIGFAVPFAYGVAALLTNQTDATWLKVTRRWTLVSWLFLGVGILFGSQWAYEELGWGGFWAWDPVENAALLPWLTSTALLHSAMIQEKKGMFKAWNMVLVMLTFVLTLFGTFLTRSGLLWSVHAFTSGPMGAYFLTFVGIVTLFCLALLLWKWPLLKPEGQYEAIVSKETGFLMNNLLLMGSVFAILWGTAYPLITEWFTPTKLTVGAPFYNRVNLPIFLALIVLMGVGPILAWRRSSLRLLRKNFLYPIAITAVVGVMLFAVGIRKPMPFVAMLSGFFVALIIALEFVKAVAARMKMTGEPAWLSFFRLFQRNRRRYGGYVAHMAIVMILFGFTGASAFDVHAQRLLHPGESIRVGNYTLTYEGLHEKADPYRTEIFADILVERDGRGLVVMRPEKVFYTTGQQPSTEVAIYHTVMEDLYVVLGGWEDETQAVAVQVKIFPLINWVWAGIYVMIAGTLIALWPERRSSPDPVRLSPHLRRSRTAMGLLLAVILGSASALGAASPAMAQQQVLWADVLEIAKEFIPPGCTETGDRCTLTTAVKMRSEIAEMLGEGMEKKEIVDAIVQRYGISVLASPPREGWGLVFWLVPYALLALAALFAGLFLNRWYRKSRSSRAVALQGQETEERGSPTFSEEHISRKLRDYL